MTSTTYSNSGCTACPLLFTFRITLLLTLVGLASCGSNAPNPPPNGVWTNWQIQAGSAITSPPNTSPSFYGAIMVQGTQAWANLSVDSRTDYSGDYSGTFNSSAQETTLTTSDYTLIPAVAPTGFSFDFVQPSTPYAVTPVNVQSGCVVPLGYTGPVCTAVTSSPSVGVEIAALNNTYTGILTASTQSDSGQATLTLTQASLYNSDGSFSLGGILTFPPGSGFGSYQVEGLIRGESIDLFHEDSIPRAVPQVSLSASTNPPATQITVSHLAYYVTLTDAVTFSGTLTRQ